MSTIGANHGSDVPTVGLVMIVRNEAHTLPRLADSLQGQIDHWTVIDTGSTDGTQDVARQVFADVPGDVVEDHWRGFGPSRNVALSHAAPHTSWLLTIDADEVIEGKIERSQLAEGVDLVSAEYRAEGHRRWAPRLLRADAGFEWRGRSHEQLRRRSGAPKAVRTKSFLVEHLPDPDRRTGRLEQDLSLLRSDWDDDLDRPRTATRLARDNEALGNFADAAGWYRARIDLGGREDEVWLTRWRLGACLLAVPSDDAPDPQAAQRGYDEATGLLWSAWADRPWRAEPLWTLAEHYRQSTRWEAAWQACAAAIRRCGVQPWRDEDDPAMGEGDSGVQRDVWTWRLAYEASIAAWYVDEPALGRRACEYLLETSYLPDELRPTVEANRTFYG